MTTTTANTEKGARYRHPPFASPVRATATPVESPEATIPPIVDFLDELPSIEDFLDAIDDSGRELPSIDNYLEEATQQAAGEAPESPDSIEVDEEGWALAGWQSFDWAGAAALGAGPGQNHTDTAWSILDWSAAVAPRPSESPAEPDGGISPTADEVARALDGIARRIRSGELVIDQLSGPPEAAMAAALAALLRMRG